MQHKNFIQQNLLIATNENLFNDKISLKVAGVKKVCKHRNVNGWCNKTQRQCALLKTI